MIPTPVVTYELTMANNIKLKHFITINYNIIIYEICFWQRQVQPTTV